MARFRYNGGFVAALPTLGLVASPGDVAELPADPGVYWTLLTDQTVPVTTAPSVGTPPPPGTYSIRLTAPAAATNVSLYASVAGVSVQAAGRTVLGVSQFTVRNLTKLGLA